jgi:hypothetical protein
MREIRGELNRSSTSKKDSTVKIACLDCGDVSEIRKKYLEDQQEDPYDIDFVLPEGWADDFATGNEAEYLTVNEAVFLPLDERIELIKERKKQVGYLAPYATEEALINAIQIGLDIGGLIPVIGEPLDGVNAAIYLARGDEVNAALSVTSMVPIVGWVSTGGKLVNKNIDVISGIYKGPGNVPTVWQGTKIVDGKTIVTDIGTFGENIAEDMLAKNGWKDFTYIKNGSDNGIDIIGRGPNGQLGFFEVKTSSTGNIPNLSARQTNMNTFAEDVLSNAANGTGRYKNIDSATRNAAQKKYDEYLSNPNNVSGNVIGVDLQSGRIQISRWER